MNPLVLVVPIVGISSYIFFNNIWSKRRPAAVEKDVTQSKEVSDHPPGNVQPFKTTNVFKGIKYFIGAPYDPVNGPHWEDSYDLYNIPRRDYFTPSGARIPTYGFHQFCRTNRPGFPSWVLPGTPLGKPGADAPLQTQRSYKNLGRHPTLLESQYLKNGY